MTLSLHQSLLLQEAFLTRMALHSPITSGQELDHSCSNVQSAEQQILEDSQLATDAPMGKHQ